MVEIIQTKPKREMNWNYLDAWAFLFVGFIWGNTYRTISLVWGTITFIVIFFLITISGYWRIKGDYIVNDEKYFPPL